MRLIKMWLIKMEFDLADDYLDFCDANERKWVN